MKKKEDILTSKEFSKNSQNYSHLELHQHMIQSLYFNWIIMLILSTTFWNAISHKHTRSNAIVYLLLLSRSDLIGGFVCLIAQCFIRIYKHCFPCWMAMKLSAVSVCVRLCVCVCLFDSFGVRWIYHCISLNDEKTITNYSFD